MKNLIYILTAVIFFSCGSGNENGNSEKTDNTVSGKISNGKGRKIYLEAFQANGILRLDSAIIGDDGSYSVKVPAKTDFYRLGFDNVNYILLSIDSNDKDVKVNANADTLSFGYTVEGSDFSKHILEFIGEQTPYIRNRQQLNDAYNLADKTDTAATNPIQRSAMRLDKAFNAYVVNFVAAHPKSPATFLALSYLDPVLQLDVIKNVEKAIAASMYNSPLHVDVLNRIGQLESQKQIQDAQLAEQERLMGHLKDGSQAPEINLPSANGGSISLSSLKGKIVLIDFWASWCKPCRAENPNVVRVYNKYKDKGFTVLSVSLDKEKNNWLNAIKQDGLIWPNHISDLKFWDCAAAKTYGITSIPFTVLVAKDGKIIAKNLRGADLENKIKTVLGE